MIEPVEKDIEVAAPPEAAFGRFTEEMDRWWPRATHTVHRERCARIHMEAGEGGRMFERSVSGEVEEWGRVTRWEPPSALAFTWYPGREPAWGQRVAMSFEAEGGGTRIRLVHSGWETLGPAARMTRDGYVSAWDPVLAAYRATFENDTDA